MNCLPARPWYGNSPSSPAHSASLPRLCSCVLVWLTAVCMVSPAALQATTLSVARLAVPEQAQATSLRTVPGSSPTASATEDKPGGQGERPEAHEDATRLSLDSVARTEEDPAGGERATAADESSSAGRASILSATTPDEHVRWKPMLLQSLNFMLVEHGFRLATQSSVRYNVLHKPFWHDFFVSEQHLDLSHWGDSDNVYTNYIGHPMEGAISGDIWIQNDPSARNARYGSGAYWRSRLKAMAWAALYSVQFEQGPIISEAAIGNQGGFYYVPDCGPAPCSKPGKKLKPPTVGTGWVDFAVTPTAGLGWILLEDLVTAKLMPRLAGDDPSLAWRFLGAVLTPSRSMASFMAGRLPWARNAQQAEIRAGSDGLSVPEAPGDDGLHYEAGIHYVSVSLPMDWQGCKSCRIVNSGVGAVFAYRLSRSFWFDSEVNYLPGAGGAEKGSAIEGLFGLRYGISGPRWGAYAKVRPGFIAYDQAASYPEENELRSLARFAFDAGTVLEYHASPRGTLRLDVGTTFVRYLQGVDPKQPPIGWISSDYYATQGNFQVAVGYLHRF